MMTDWWCVPEKQRKMKDETLTLAEAHIGIDGDARRRHRRLRGGGSGETRDELIEPSHRVLGGARVWPHCRLFLFPFPFPDPF